MWTFIRLELGFIKYDIIMSLYITSSGNPVTGTRFRRTRDATNN